MRSADGPVERQSVDTRFHVRGSRTASDKIAIVAYDNRTLRALDVRPPVPRSVQAKVIDSLDRAGASVVAFDYSLEQSSGDQRQDRAVALALMNARHAVVSVTAPEQDGSTANLAGFIPFSDIDVRPGFTPLQLDGQGVVRRFRRPPPGLQAFPLAAVEELTGKNRIAVPRGALIDYPGPTGTFKQLSYVDVLHGSFDPAAVRGRIVIVGPTATVLNDTHRVPVDSTMPGSEIHAAAMASALAGFPLREVSAAAARRTTLLLGFAVPLLLLAGALVAHAVRTARKAGGVLLEVPGTPAVLATGGLAICTWLVVAQVAFNDGTVVELVPGLVAVVVSTAAAEAAAQRMSARARRDVRTRFAARDATIMREVLASRGRRRAMTASDVIAGYVIQDDGVLGGMGAVYRANQVRLDRDVAIKVILPRYATQRAYRKRFVDEAYRAASLSHPNIVPVIDAGEADHILYIVMQRIDGHSLQSWLGSDRRLEPQAAVQMLHRVACALDHANATAGLVHRDVKPSNILIPRTSPRHPFLTDFGVAGTSDDAGRGGTPEYRPPEQDSGRPGDIYALAVVLFQCLTQELPDPAAPIDVRLGSAVNAVIARGLAADPGARYPSASALTGAAAEALGADVTSDASTPEPLGAPEGPHHAAPSDDIGPTDPD